MAAPPAILFFLEDGLDLGVFPFCEWEDGLERCVGCELCAIVCPAQAIYVKPAENELGNVHSHGERYASDFQINMIRCIYCGYCEEAFPRCSSTARAV